MIRVVLDTNIVISALLQSLGPSARILLSVLGGPLQLCISGSIYTEYEEVLRRPRLKRDEGVVDSALRSIRDNGLWVRPAAEIVACVDPDDNIFLECARAAQAHYLMTGNLKHFPGSWAEIRIVSPRWVVDHVLEQKSGE